MVFNKPPWVTNGDSCIPVGDRGGSCTVTRSPCRVTFCSNIRQGVHAGSVRRPGSPVTVIDLKLVESMRGLYSGWEDPITEVGWFPMESMQELCEGQDDPMCDESNCPGACLSRAPCRLQMGKAWDLLPCWSTVFVFSWVPSCGYTAVVLAWVGFLWLPSPLWPHGPGDSSEAVQLQMTVQITRCWIGTPSPISA